jgi:two-component system response regulator YesN
MTIQREQILIAMKAGLKAKVLEMLDSLYLHLKDLSPDSMLHGFKCLELVSVCMEYAAENSLDLTQKLGDYPHIVQEIENRKSMEERNKYIKDIFIMTMNLVSEGKASRMEFSKNVMAYIDENIMNCELDIEMVANRFFINYSHLCRCFKKEAGLTINEYITGIRLKKAKELMDEGFHVVQHVSCKVGYSDPNYFTKCFRKYFGISPHQYIESKSHIYP